MVSTARDKASMIHLRAYNCLSAYDILPTIVRDASVASVAICVVPGNGVAKALQNVLLPHHYRSASLASACSIAADAYVMLDVHVTVERACASHAIHCCVPHSISYHPPISSSYYPAPPRLSPAILLLVQLYWGKEENY